LDKDRELKDLAIGFAEADKLGEARTIPGEQRRNCGIAMACLSGDM
jgi:hypothetical protein